MAAFTLARARAHTHTHTHTHTHIVSLSLFNLNPLAHFSLTPAQLLLG